ncbi:unnamed protein product [Schistosoma mansoni]|uniref:Smp_204950 n=1 Tax=Schistosoma mansoni TaxID=6183 RepID=UPI00022C865D|nr:unnamed protein product [Schistosoma mansoni]|eukprot:XP_018647005.1 unnamed protein product [Schistosoma mansoni]
MGKVFLLRTVFMLLRVHTNPVCHVMGVDGLLTYITFAGTDGLIMLNPPTNYKYQMRKGILSYPLGIHLYPQSNM